MQIQYFSLITQLPVPLYLFGTEPGQRTVLLSSGRIFTRQRRFTVAPVYDRTRCPFGCYRPEPIL